MGNLKILKNEEKAIYDLRELYLKYGYSHFKVSKFEEYDLYAKNKNFLVSERILTFNDINGKLMALKPDITLSIIKNVENSRLPVKVCYNETVYRTPSDSEGFREIMQTGLEYIGELDTYSECEVIMLALRSLERISPDCRLDISHMGFLLSFFEYAAIPSSEVSVLLKYMSSKNIVAVTDFCEKNDVSAENCELLIKLCGIYLPLDAAFIEIMPYIANEGMRNAVGKLAAICHFMKIYGFSTDKIYLDFSVVNDMDYYDDIIFRGFINGIFDGVLSGGRYDSIVKSLGKNTGAIGFAVYLDKLGQLSESGQAFDADVLLEYTAQTSPEEIIKHTERIIAEGKSVRTHCLSGTEDSGRYRNRIVIGEEN